MPELPAQLRRRLKEQYQLTDDIIDRLCSISENENESSEVFAPAARYFENVASSCGAIMAGNWYVGAVKDNSTI